MVSYANGGAAQGPKGVESGAEKRRGHLNAISLSTRPQSKIESRLFPIQDRAPPRLLFSLSKPTCDVSHAILKQKEKPERRRKEVGTGKAPPFSSLFLMQAEERASVINKAREKKKVRRPVFPVFFRFHFHSLFLRPASPSATAHPLPSRHQRPALRRLLPLEKLLARQQVSVNFGGEALRFVATG